MCFDKHVNTDLNHCDTPAPGNPYDMIDLNRLQCLTYNPQGAIKYCPRKQVKVYKNILSAVLVG